jgi:hypothetical protein
LCFVLIDVDWIALRQEVDRSPPVLLAIEVVGGPSHRGPWGSGEILGLLRNFYIHIHKHIKIYIDNIYICHIYIIYIYIDLMYIYLLIYPYYISIYNLMVFHAGIYMDSR